MRTKIVSILAVALAACGADTGEETAVPSYCSRYQERRGEACHEVRTIGLEEREIAFERDGYTLNGTLVVPVTEGEYLAPLFVLVHGSGPNDRDETTDGNLGIRYGVDVPTFRLLAEGLAAAGAAVFRYDKRSCFLENSAGRCPNSGADYPGDLGALLVDDYVFDLRAAVRAAGAQAGIDAADVTVIGHSQGGNFVPQVADEPGVIGGVQLAAPSLPIDEVVVEQLRLYADDLEAKGFRFAADAAVYRAEADRFEVALGQIRDGTYEGTHFEGAPVAHWRNWFERTDHLREEFLAMEQPNLVLNGDLDFNVRSSHLDRFRDWAEEAGKENASFLLVPGATHSFVQLTDGGRGLGELFSDMALDGIVEWHRSLSRTD